MTKMSEIASPPLEIPTQGASRRPTLRVWIAAAFLGLLLGFGGALIAQKYFSPKAADYVELAPDFELALLTDQGTLKLADLRGKGVVLNFWASWCVPCRTEMPALQSAWERYQDDGIVFVGINLWDEEPAALEFLNEFGVTYPNGFDALDNIDKNYNLLGVPTTWFIYPDGSIARKVMGPLDLESLDEAIALIMND